MKGFHSNNMKDEDFQTDPRKRPLLTPEQLRRMRGVPALKLASVSPREEFEALFQIPNSKVENSPAG
jgi:hypothetical protein